MEFFSSKALEVSKTHARSGFPVLYKTHEIKAEAWSQVIYVWRHRVWERRRAALRSTPCSEQWAAQTERDWFRRVISSWWQNMRQVSGLTNDHGQHRLRTSLPQLSSQGWGKPLHQIKVRAPVMVLQEPRQGCLGSIHQHDLALGSQVQVFWRIVLTHY